MKENHGYTIVIGGGGVVSGPIPPRHPRNFLGMDPLETKTILQDQSGQYHTDDIYNAIYEQWSMPGIDFFQA